MDFSVVVFNLPIYAQAAFLTVRIAALGIAVACAMGVVCAVCTYFQVPVARQLVRVYVEVSRNTPLLVQLFFLYFGLPKVGVVLSSEMCAVLGLGFLGGSFMAEAVRSGLDSVADIQMQSAVSLGFSRMQALRHIVLPQAGAFALPPVIANVIFLVKETSVVGVVALPELVFVAKEQIGQSYETREALFLLVSFYVLILLPLSLGAQVLEKKVRAHVFGA